MINSLIVATIVIIVVTVLIYAYQRYNTRYEVPPRYFVGGVEVVDGNVYYVDGVKYYSNQYIRYLKTKEKEKLEKEARENLLLEKMKFTTKEYHDTLLNYDKGFLK